MSSRCLARLAAALSVLAAAGPVSAAEPFRICAEPDSLPLSDESSGTGLEIEVGQLLADEMGRPFEVRWIAQRDHAFFRQTLGAGACDAIMSVPVGFDRLTMTDPWYRTGFVFVSRPGEAAPSGFDDARLATLDIGVPVSGLGDGTPPAIALARRALVDNIRPYSIYEPGKLVEAVSGREVDLSILWGPFAGWYSAIQTEPLVITRAQAMDGATPFAFDIAIGLKKGNDTLKEELDLALERRREDIEAALERWRVPHGPDW